MPRVYKHAVICTYLSIIKICNCILKTENVFYDLCRIVRNCYITRPFQIAILLLSDSERW